MQPLPHQIRAVYGELLPRTPLRFLLADDPGAGKTIMAGLYIKELILRDDVRTCLLVAPGGLVLEQLEQAEFDVAVVDEAHRMSASWFSGELKASKRFQLGELLSEHARHFLLMTATPHDGKEEGGAGCAGPGSGSHPAIGRRNAPCRVAPLRPGCLPALGGRPRRVR